MKFISLQSRFKDMIVVNYSGFRNCETGVWQRMTILVCSNWLRLLCIWVPQACPCFLHLIFILTEQFECSPLPEIFKSTEVQLDLDVGSTKRTAIALCRKRVKLWLSECTTVSLCVHTVDLLPLQCILDAPILLSFPRMLLFLFSSSTNLYLYFHTPSCGSCKEVASQTTLMS